MDALRNQAREALLQRRSSLCGLLRGTRGDVEELHSRRTSDAAEAAAEERAGALLERLSERERRELRDIEDALVRLEQGGFGHCARCGGAIGRHRLRAIPEARHCMACSEQVGR